MSGAIDPQLQAKYDGYYTPKVVAWRELGARYKAERMLALTRSLPARSLLDCGAGDGAVLATVAAAGRFEPLHAVEVSDSGLERLVARAIPGLASALKFDGYRIPHADGAFDLALACHVIEHVEHPRILLRELMRVSRYQVFEVPLEYAADVDRDMQDKLAIGHINVYTPALFRFLLKSEGLSIVAEQLSRSPREMVRYRWYELEGRRFSPVREARLLASPLAQRLKQRLRGRLQHEERDFDTFTVLTRRNSD